MKKITSLVLAVLMICAIIPLTAVSAFASSGTDGCVKWEINGTTLTISAVPGTDGKIDDYYNEYHKWYYADADGSYAYKKSRTS